MEEAAALIKGTVVSVECVFKHETNRIAVAEVFRTLQAETGTGVLTGGQGELIGLDTIGIFRVGPVHAEVDETIELNVGSESRAGKGTESGDGSFPRGSVEMARTLLHCACTVVRSFLKTCEAFFQRTFRPCEIFTVALTRQTRRIARPSGAST